LNERLKTPHLALCASIPLIALVLLCMVATQAATRTIERLEADRRSLKAVRPVLKFVRLLKRPEAVVLVDPYADGYNRLPRLLSVPTLISRKFIPTRPSEIVEWYTRLTFRDAIFAQGCTKPMKYHIDYILIKASRWEQEQSKYLTCGSVVLISKNYILVRVH
jgi:hypothetical protein